MRSILIVMADSQVRERLAVLLRQEIECVVLEAEHPDVALTMIKEEQISLMITDLFPPEKKGLELLRLVPRINPSTDTIVCIPEGAWESGVEAMRDGAFSIIKAPYDLTEVVITAARGLLTHDLVVHKAQQSRKIRKSDGCHGMLGSSEPMRKLFDIIGKVAADDTSTVLVQGETGTGKELVARAIHGRGPRQTKNFVPVNCAAIPDDLLESELFGYVKGAFTGATASKVGRVQYADGGTLFLDEIGDMKPSLQAKLLRVLQEKEFEPLGGVKPVSVDVRVIAATHRNLEKAVAEGTFREDLFYRLSVFPLHIPPLRKRKGDIPLLIDNFVRVFNRKRLNPFLGFEPRALESLVRYSWPGNVRELENLVQRMAILHAGVSATLNDLPAKYSTDGVLSEPAPHTDVKGCEPPDGNLLQQGGRIDFNDLIESYERKLIVRALEMSGGNKKEAALLLGLNRTTLLEKIKRKKLEVTVNRVITSLP